LSLARTPEVWSIFRWRDDAGSPWFTARFLNVDRQVQGECGPQHVRFGPALGCPDLAFEVPEYRDMGGSTIGINCVL
jgi:hypothetical protein